MFSGGRATSGGSSLLKVAPWSSSGLGVDCRCGGSAAAGTAGGPDATGGDDAAGGADVACGAGACAVADGGCRHGGVNGPVRTAVVHVAAVFAPAGANTDAGAPPMAAGLAGIATAPIVAPMAALAAMVPIAAALPRNAASLAAIDPFAAALQSAAPSVAVLQSAPSPYMIDITKMRSITTTRQLVIPRRCTSQRASMEGRPFH